MIDETHQGFMAHRKQFSLTPIEAKVSLQLLDLKYTREITGRLELLGRK